MDKWIQIKVHCATEDLEMTAAVMSMIDNTLLIEDPTDIDNLETIYGELIDEGLENADRSRGSVSLFVAEQELTPEMILALSEQLEAAGISHTVEQIGREESDWQECWKQYYKPLALGQSLTVVPIWERDSYSAKEGERLVYMDPGVAFGSGTHESTRLCAALMERHLSEGMQVLDVGTGSGILAIAAARLGAARIMAYDLDPVAVRIAGENCAENGVDDRIECGVSDLLADVAACEGGYDMITANIVADIILRMAPDVSRFLKKDGILVVSGIIERQAEQVRQALTAQGLSVIDSISEHDWNALALKKI